MKHKVGYTVDTIYSISCNYREGLYIGQTSEILNHNFNIEGVKVLVTEKSLNKRLFHEMVQIYYNANSINKRTDIDNLSIYILSE